MEWQKHKLNVQNTKFQSCNCYQYSTYPLSPRMITFNKTFFLVAISKNINQVMKVNYKSSFLQSLLFILFIKFCIINVVISNEIVISKYLYSALLPNGIQNPFPLALPSPHPKED